MSKMLKTDTLMYVFLVTSTLEKHGTKNVNDIRNRDLTSIQTHLVDLLKSFLVFGIPLFALCEHEKTYSTGFPPASTEFCRKGKEKKKSDLSCTSSKAHLLAPQPIL